MVEIGAFGWYGSELVRIGGSAAVREVVEAISLVAGGYLRGWLGFLQEGEKEERKEEEK